MYHLEGVLWGDYYSYRGCVADRKKLMPSIRCSVTLLSILTITQNMEQQVHLWLALENTQTHTSHNGS